MKLGAFLLLLGLGASLALPAEPARKVVPTVVPGFNSVEPEFREELTDVPDVPGLPRVLLIGDSISLGYTLQVRARLAGKANVHRIPENAGWTGFGLSRLDDWLEPGAWDVIHFNFGLHDLKYLDAAGNYVGPPAGKQVTPLPQYLASLRAIVLRLRSTQARLIFATTTPVPDGAPGRIPGSERAYNQAAAGLMHELGVALDDLHARALAGGNALQLPRNVHFTPAGRDYLAGAVAESILSALKSPPPPSSHP